MRPEEEANMATSSVSQQSNSTAYYRHMLSNRPHPLQKIDHLVVITPFQRGWEVCSQGQPADHWYSVI